MEDLSPRRLELLQLVAKGLTNDEIAGVLTITPGTVRSHITALLAHLDVSNRTEAAAAYLAWEARPTQVAAVMQRPAIAVLPFAAAGDDAHTRTLAAGLTEDLASLFARWCWFPVIATTSSAHARNLGTSTRDIAAALGARFLVDGSVRVAGASLRISARIDDGETGHQLWTDRIDCPTEAVFEAQDAVCHAIVAAAYPMLIARAQAVSLHSRPTAELDAWELAHDGMSLRNTREPESNAAAIRRFTEAIGRDPQLVLAHFGRGLAAYDAVLNQWGPKDKALDLLLSAAERCVELSPHAAEGHYLLGRHLQSRGEWERAVAPLEAALGRNPSFAIAHATLAQSLQASGRSEEALIRMQHAVRLGPRSFVVGLATLQFMSREYRQALEGAERAIVTNPGYAFARGIAAASAYYLGDTARGRAHFTALQERQPGFRPAGFAATFGTHFDAVTRFTLALEALRDGP